MLCTLCTQSGISLLLLFGICRLVRRIELLSFHALPQCDFSLRWVFFSVKKMPKMFFSRCSLNELTCKWNEMGWKKVTSLLKMIHFSPLICRQFCDIRETSARSAHTQHTTPSNFKSLFININTDLSQVLTNSQTPPQQHRHSEYRNSRESCYLDLGSFFA